MSELILDELIVDTLLYIAEYLRDRDMINFLSINKKMYSLIDRVISKEYHWLEEIEEIFEKMEGADDNIASQIKLPKKNSMVLIISRVK